MNDAGYHSARDHEGDLDLATDVVVVGSGAGGAVVATELAEAGQRVLVLEEGPRVEAEHYGRMRPSESIRHMWRDGAMTLALGVGDSPSINVTMGRVVGGSSVLTGGVCFRIPEPVLDVWRREYGLADFTPKRMEPYFEHVERAVHVEEVPADMLSRSTELFALGARKKGFELKPMRRNTRNCEGCGRCNFGCPKGAKLSVDLSYLPRAVASGAAVWSHCLVERILVEGDRAVGVSGRLLNDIDGRPRGRLTVRAGRVVLAAGAWHGPAILRRSGIGRRSKQVGRNLSLHPGFRMIARFREPVRGWVGALQGAFSDAFERDGLTMTALFIPPGVLGATMPGIGVEHTDNTRNIDRLAVFGGIIHDGGNGVVRGGLGREPLVTYRMSPRDRSRVSHLLRLMAETFFEAGAELTYLPVLGTRGMDADTLRAFDLERVPGRLIESSSQHPLGSCRMGTSARDSVVSPDGAVWDVNGLHIVDGSILPTSLGVNPQLSIMAMATRIAWKLRDAPGPGP